MPFPLVFNRRADGTYVYQARRRLLHTSFRPSHRRLSHTKRRAKNAYSEALLAASTAQRLFSTSAKCEGCFGGQLLKTRTISVCMESDIFSEFCAYTAFSGIVCFSKNCVLPIFLRVGFGEATRPRLGLKFLRKSRRFCEWYLELRTDSLP